MPGCKIEVLPDNMEYLTIQPLSSSEGVGLKKFYCNGTTRITYSISAYLKLREKFYFKFPIIYHNSSPLPFPLSLHMTM